MAAAPTGLALVRLSGERLPPLQHGEAYCLMKYASKAGAIEWLWNSRDGVTPFGIGPASDDNAMLHADWHEDSFAPNFVPPVGMRVFMSWSDAPPSYKLDTAARWSKRIADAPADQREELARAEPFGFRPEDPCVVTVDEALREVFLAQARDRLMHPKEAARGG